eukprot:14179647-Alexandrium_andersonii.AAC.1
MDGIEGGGEEDDVVVVGQVGAAPGGSAARSRSFADRLRQKTVQAAKVKKAIARKTSAPSSRKPPRLGPPARARTATPARPFEAAPSTVPRP